jgi:hypothetical protein
VKGVHSPFPLIFLAMSTVLAMIDRVEKLNIDDAVQLSIEDTRVDITAAQNQQMADGKQSDGKNISPGYKPTTIAIKKRKGQPYDRVTLKDTGAFYKATFADVRDKEIIIDSADSKTEALLKKYGDKIFGLQPVVLAEYTNGPFYKRLKDIITNRTGLAFTK